MPASASAFRLASVADEIVGAGHDALAGVYRHLLGQSPLGSLLERSEVTLYVRILNERDKIQAMARVEQAAAPAIQKISTRAYPVD